MKNKFIFVLIGLLLGCSTTWSQRGFNTNDRNTFFGQFSYNRSVYSASDIHVESNNYKYTLEKVRLSDDVDAIGLDKYFSGSSPQFNIKIGYYISDKWAITASYDKYNTFFVVPQKLQLSGTFAPSGNYPYKGGVQKEIQLNRNNFDLQQRSGVHFIALGIQRNDQIYRTRKGSFAIQLVYGIKIGGLITKVDYTFNNTKTQDISSFSGIGLGANFDLKFDFAQYIFLQIGVDGGLLNQNKIKIAPASENFAKQITGYLSPHIGIGFSVPFNGANCGTCPQW